MKKAAVHLLQLQSFSDWIFRVHSNNKLQEKENLYHRHTASPTVVCESDRSGACWWIVQWLWLIPPLHPIATLRNQHNQRKWNVASPLPWVSIVRGANLLTMELFSVSHPYPSLIYYESHRNRRPFYRYLLSWGLLFVTSFRATTLRFFFSIFCSVLFLCSQSAFLKTTHPNLPWEIVNRFFFSPADVVTWNLFSISKTNFQQQQQKWHLKSVRWTNVDHFYCIFIALILFLDFFLIYLYPKPKFPWGLIKIIKEETLTIWVLSV